MEAHSGQALSRRVGGYWQPAGWGQRCVWKSEQGWPCSAVRSKIGSASKGHPQLQSSQEALV